MRTFFQIIATCFVFIISQQISFTQGDLTSDLILSPDTLMMNVGDTTDLILKLDLHGGDNAVDGVEVYIDFDTSAFEIIEVEDIYGFQFELLNDTLGGRIRFAAGILTSQPISQDADLLKIRVRSKSFIENSGFTIDHDEEGKSSEVAQSGGFASLNKTSPAILSTMGICFNSNGSFYRTLDSTFFVSDGSFKGGSGVVQLQEIENTEDDELFQTAREGEFQYDIALPNGRYQTQLFYSEIKDNTDSRLMDIRGEGQLLRSEFDILSEAVVSRTAFIDTLFINVEDDTLNLDFQKSANSVLEPLISGICLTYSEPLAVVPVELISFRARLENGDGLLNWESYAEVGFSHYEVQKSLTKSSWKNIGIVNGGSEQNEFRDRSLESGKITYYRLKMVDYNGHVEFSEIVSLTRNNSVKDFSVYPNPTSDILYIDITDLDRFDISIYLVNALGQKTEINSSDHNSIAKLNVANFTPGFYFIQIVKGREVLINESVIIK
ncbi:malectin domain-containing carbohydrate-binding protein [Portibacter lacus]|nr:malectin domain-containing carbohydrate-binding protein [Portibacter lacus]